MREQLDLPGTIKQDIIIPQALQLFLQPLDILIQLLQRIQDAAVRAQPRVVVVHDRLQRDEIAHVHRRRVGCAVVRRVEVDDRAFPADRAHELLHPVAVC